MGWGLLRPPDFATNDGEVVTEGVAPPPPPPPLTPTPSFFIMAPSFRPERARHERAEWRNRSEAELGVANLPPHHCHTGEVGDCRQP